MILYFSGTGNSQLVAHKLAVLLSDVAHDITSAAPLPALRDDETLGLVFPVYAWGVPTILERYLINVSTQIGSCQRFVWAVLTCGDDMGYADRRLNRALRRAALPAASLIRSVPMPNTYVSLPGFDVDAPELAARKVQTTEALLPQIVREVEERCQVLDVVRGGMAWVKTYVLRPLFVRFLITDRPFRVDADRCTRCGRCARQCPVADITLHDGLPAWTAHRCTSCLRCYHQCPSRAIDWGRWTRGKGQKGSL